MNNPEIIIPVLGIMCGIIVPLAVFVWLYNERAETFRPDFPRFLYCISMPMAF